MLTAEKRWMINGVEYVDGTQPAGFVATPTLDGKVAAWNTDYVGLPAGSTVEVGETWQVPSDCTSSATGLGPVEVSTAQVTVAVVNTVLCAGPVPPIPPEPPIPPYPPLPDTGFAVGPYLGWAIGLLVVGALLLIGSALRPNGPSRRNGSAARS